jgi:hypothetical protein
VTEGKTRGINSGRENYGRSREKVGAKQEKEEKKDKAGLFQTSSRHIFPRISPYSALRMRGKKKKKRWTSLSLASVLTTEIMEISIPLPFFCLFLLLRPPAPSFRKFLGLAKDKLQLSL